MDKSAPNTHKELVIRRFHLYLVNLQPPVGPKPGKIRPCVVIQDDALNEVLHPSTVILPISSKNVVTDAYPLRVYLPQGEGGIEKNSVVLVDQVLSWDNRRFVEHLGILSTNKATEIMNAFKNFIGW